MQDYVPVVRELRTRLGLTQEDFARALGITVSTVCRWEKGHSKPSKLACMSLNRMAGLRGVDVSSLVARAERPAL